MAGKGIPELLNYKQKGKDLFFSGGSADGTLLFCSVGAQLKYQDSFCPGFVFQIIPDADT